MPRDLRQRLQLALVLLAVLLTLSVAGYRLLGGSSVGFLQALYMAVITLAGVGYGEIVDTSHNPWLRVFNMVVVLIGVATMVYVFSVVTAFLVEGELTHIFWRRKMEKKIKDLKDHYIVCGLGDTGRYVVDELQRTGSPFVVVEHSEEVLARYREQGDGGRELLSITGDATDEEVLLAAGLERAHGVIAALAAEKDNLVITVMVRQKSPGVRIVARCTDLKYADKLLRAGADTTVSPNHIGGLRLASEVLRPHVVSFLDLMLKEQSKTLRIEEIDVGPSTWVGLKLSELQLKPKYNLLLLAVKDAATTYWANPPENLAIREGTVLIVMGDVAQVKRARAEAMHRHSARSMVAGH